MHRLRLSDGRGQTVEFSSEPAILPSQVNNAYLSFCQHYKHAGLILEIFHKTHGWQPVYDTQGYCKMIQNPLKLDYSSLKKDIYHTLSVVDRWPTRKQRLISENQRKAEERERQAQRLRKGFRLVNCQ